MPSVTMSSNCPFFQTRKVSFLKVGKVSFLLLIEQVIYAPINVRPAEGGGGG